MKDNILEAFANLTNKKNLGLVQHPFNTRGKTKKAVVIFSFFLENKSKKKVDILIEGGILTKSVEEVNIGSYYSTWFSSLSQIKAIRYDSSTQSWGRGDNFHAYFAHLIESMLAVSKEKVHSLLSKEQIQRLDNDFNKVTLEMLEDHATVNTLKRMWRGNKDAVVDYILNAN